jgi:choline dehydrogenase-like flavoprotein
VDEGHVDVLIVGGGAAGGVAGRRLAEAGFAVLCLEQGEWPDRTAYPGATPEWELAAAKQWSGVPSVRNRPADYPLDLSDSDLGVVNFNGVGGGTILYAAQWPRMLPTDFLVRSTDGIADDWPIGYAELLPFYERTDRQFGVSGLGGNPAYPPGEDPPLPPAPMPGSGGIGGPSTTPSCQPPTTDVIPACSEARAGPGATREPRRRPTSPIGPTSWLTVAA